MRTKTNASRRPSRRTNSTASKIVSAGLATATCVGLVGVIGIRTAQDSAAADSSSATQSQASAVAIPTSTDGYTQADLDAYAAQLAAEAQRLTDYRAQLVEAAQTLQASAGGSAGVTVSDPAAVPANQQAPSVKKPKPAVSKPAAQAAPKPQSNTKSS
ncbi:MAG: hypothetical protein F2840_04445 [Actinobacteria bacterium]|jgi:hypothetical protein|uniref:Unannotated protein n=1 Tax=freshwater metagenome TaxID=449393 RepID=A0A6J7JCZ9_9ZZZZ|nr:hypothetical protein [Actinomycetota bacterium]